MAGTIFGLGLSQRVDSNGKPALGWLLYLYDQNTSTPVNSYSDTGLTVLNPWPIEADANGTMGQFWLADGSYRARATNSDGSIVYFDIQSVLALGASSGSAPSGGVDPNAIFKTGDSDWQPVQGTRSGWVRDNGRTIGSATSGATERDNADCQALFLYLWNTYSDSFCPVVTGRGANAAADWAANKKITMFDLRGFVPGGLDDMGNAAAGRMASAPVLLGGVTTAGSLLGVNTHTLGQNELPNVNFVHSGTAIASHSHTLPADVTGAAAVGSAGVLGKASTSGTVSPGTNSFTVTVSAQGTAASGGNDDPHNIMQKTVLGTFYRKL